MYVAIGGALKIVQLTRTLKHNVLMYVAIGGALKIVQLTSTLLRRGANPFSSLGGGEGIIGQILLKFAISRV